MRRGARSAGLGSSCSRSRPRTRIPRRSGRPPAGLHPGRHRLRAHRSDGDFLLPRRTHRDRAEVWHRPAGQERRAAAPSADRPERPGQRLLGPRSSRYRGRPGLRRQFPRVPAVRLREQCGRLHRDQDGPAHAGDGHRRYRRSGQRGRHPGHDDPSCPARRFRARTTRPAPTASPRTAPRTRWGTSSSLPTGRCSSRSATRQASTRSIPTPCGPRTWTPWPGR